jgi:hypothetical protein
MGRPRVTDLQRVPPSAQLFPCGNSPSAGDSGHYSINSKENSAERLARPG